MEDRSKPPQYLVTFFPCGFGGVAPDGQAVGPVRVQRAEAIADCWKHYDAHNERIRAASVKALGRWAEERKAQEERIRGLEREVNVLRGLLDSVRASKRDGARPPKPSNAGQKNTKWTKGRRRTFTNREQEERNTMQDKIDINGITYVREQARTGNRAVVVVDRGWIFAGDVTEEDGRIRISRAVHVFRWTGGQGFAAMIADPQTDVDLRPCADVDLPEGAEIFRVPVCDDWGLS